MAAALEQQQQQQQQQWWSCQPSKAATWATDDVLGAAQPWLVALLLLLQVWC